MKGFLKTGLIKLPKNKSFDYQPRYFDERKERLQKREEELKQRMNKNGDLNSESGTQFNFRRASSLGNHRSKEMTKSNIRLIVIMFLLLAIFYYMFKNVDQVSNLFQR
jgi:predicted PurR-regulated permease PerM